MAEFTKTDENNKGNNTVKIESPDTDENKKDNNTVKQQDNGANVDNKIYRNITVLDKRPIVILFGPKDCGKTTVFVRMLRYFASKTDSNNHNYCDFVFDRSFRKGDKYKEECSKMERYVRDKKMIPASTPDGAYLLAKITECGNTVFQFLEAAGEDYVPEPNKQITSDVAFKDYLKNISRLPNKRIWVFFFNLKLAEDNADWREEYFKRIIKAKRELVKEKDSVIILFDKADETEEYFVGDDRPNLEQFIERAKELYQDSDNNCFSLFSIPRFLRSPKEPDAVAFSSGKRVKNVDNDDKEEWEEGAKSYCVAFETAINDAL